MRLSSFILTNLSLIFRGKFIVVSAILFFNLFFLHAQVKVIDGNTADSLVRQFPRMTVEERAMYWNVITWQYLGTRSWEKINALAPQLLKDLPKLKNSPQKVAIICSFAHRMLVHPNPRIKPENLIRQAEVILLTLSDQVEKDEATSYLYDIYVRKYESNKNMLKAEEYFLKYLDLLMNMNKDTLIHDKIHIGIRQFYYNNNYHSIKQLDYANKLLDYALKNFPPIWIGEAEAVVGEISIKYNQAERGYELMSKGLARIEKHDPGNTGMMNEAGYVFLQNGNYPLAIRYFRKIFNRVYIGAIEAEKRGENVGLQYSSDVAQFAINLSEPFARLGQWDSMMHYSQLALKYAQRGDNNLLIMASKSRIAKSYLNFKQYDKFITFAKAFTEDFEKYGTGMPLVPYVSAFYNIHRAYHEIHKPDSAKFYFKKAQEKYASVPNPTHDLKITRFRNEVLYYREIEKNPSQSLISSDSLVFYLDSLIKTKDQLKISDALMRYDTESRENQIKALNQEKELAALQSRHKNFLLFGIGAVLLLSVGMVGLLFARNKAKQRTNQLLASQNEAIQKMNAELADAFGTIQLQHEEISNAYEELNTTLEHVQEQKKEIEDKNLKIEDSIHYAKRIQEAILPNLESLNDYFSAYWIYYHPRDIVSGDFYWYAIKGNTVFVAVVDCTGHGVPGAFMSVVGFNLLNEIINEPEERTVDAILSELNRRVTLTLHQDRHSDNKDGMDIVMISYQKANHTLTYAGAGRPLYLLKQGEFIEIKANKFPIGGGQHEDKTFHAHTVEVHQGDKIYLFTDGITDQFGGPEKRKFTPKRLQEFIITHPNLSASDLEDDFTRLFDAWRRGRTQIDDLTLMMIEI